LFLTRLTLNTARRGARLLLTSPQAMHAAVLSSFPPSDGDAPGADGRVLWRIDRTTPARRAPDRIDLLVSSPDRPDLSHIVEQAGWPAAEAGWETVEIDRMFRSLEPGQRWRFRLTANPVRSSKAPGERRGKVFAHVTADQQLGWLIERAGRNGFSLVNDDDGNPLVQVTERRTLSFRREERRPNVQIGTARFDGVLEVTDSDTLRDALANGIGRAKAYGCGLLTLAR